MARPQFQPTEEQRRLVRTMASFGIPQDDIAVVLEIAPKTLRAHFRSELDRAAIEANARVMGAMYKMATSGEHPAASIFWLKTRCRWSDKSVLEQGPVQPPQLHLRLDEARHE